MKAEFNTFASTIRTAEQRGFSAGVALVLRIVRDTLPIVDAYAIESRVMRVTTPSAAPEANGAPTLFGTGTAGAAEDAAAVSNRTDEVSDRASGT